MKNEEIATVLKVSMKKIDRIKKRFVEEGLEIALNGHKARCKRRNKSAGKFPHIVVLLTHNFHCFHDSIFA